MSLADDIRADIYSVSDDLGDPASLVCDAGTFPITAMQTALVQSTEETGKSRRQVNSCTFRFVKPIGYNVSQGDKIVFPNVDETGDEQTWFIDGQNTGYGRSVQVRATWTSIQSIGQKVRGNG